MLGSAVRRRRRCSSTGWRRPTSYVEFGAEVGRGRGFPGSDSGAQRRRHGRAHALHTGGDIGDSHSWRAGAVDARRQGERPGAGRRSTRRRPVHRQRVQRPHARLVADAVWKWAPNGNATRTNFKLQGEYLRSTRSGSLAYDAGGRRPATATTAPRSRAGTCRASTSSCRAGASACAPSGSTPARRTTAPTPACSAPAASSRARTR